MLIRGNDLNPAQRRQVIAAFVHRWTHENAKRNYGGKCPACVQRFQCEPNATLEINGVPWHEYHVPLTSDNEWIRGHAFHFTRDGSRLSARHSFCEPDYLTR